MLIELIDWSVALVPVLLLVAMFIWLDVFKLMSVWETLGLLLLGGLSAIAAYPLSGIFLDQLPIGFSAYSRFVAPWIEEALKTLVVISLFRFNRIGFKLDAVISGFAVGAGFAVVENIIFLWRFPELGAETWMVRGLGTAVMHGTTLAILAAIAHEFAEKETREAAADYDFRAWWFVPGFLLAVALHTAFNFFPDRPLQVMLVTLVAAPLLILMIFRFGSLEAQDWLREEQDEHREILRSLEKGVYPQADWGRRIQALADRCDPDTARHILEYCKVQAGLVLTAEETLMGQAQQHERLEAEALGAFRRRDELRHRLGRTTFAALEPLLPFSRNDQWEVSELKERLKRRGGA